MTDALFLILSCVTVVAAILVVSPRNPIYGALSLLVMMISLSMIFLQLSAPFLAIMQIVVYAGAVVVLFLFVIMLMNLDPVEMGQEKGIWFKLICFFLAGFMALFVVVAIFKSNDGLPKKFRQPAPARQAPGHGEGPARQGFRVHGQGRVCTLRPVPGPVRTDIDSHRDRGGGRRDPDEKETRGVINGVNSCSTCRRA
ncbi:MAG: NADH-quinone oxidoreductase subunit J family protein [Planctomycetota bacterium]|jgi:NADH:ubiquinone oxidoreductase subunit 6 (subunit J)